MHGLQTLIKLNHAPTYLSYFNSDLFAVGAKVLIGSNRTGPAVQEHTVERNDIDSQFLTVNGVRFAKSNAFSVGEDYPLKLRATEEGLPVNEHAEKFGRYTAGGNF
jgi:hypothetical protein